MKYATWNLHFTDNLGTGPEETALASGVPLAAVWSSGNPEDGADILGKFDGTLSGLETWNFTEISRAEAEALVLSNHTDRPQNSEAGLEEWTAEKAIATLD